MSQQRLPMRKVRDVLRLKAAGLGKRKIAAIASRGGNPLVVGGKLIGAIGVSGGTGSQDDVVSQAGVAAIK